MDNMLAQQAAPTAARGGGKAAKGGKGGGKRAVARVVAVAHQTRFAPPPSTPDTRLEPAERRRQRCGRRRPLDAVGPLLQEQDELGGASEERGAERREESDTTRHLEHLECSH